MRFDYLHAARPLPLQRLLEMRIPERFQSAVVALAGVFVVIGGAWGIEVYRLREALRVEAVYRQRYDVTQRALNDTNIYYGRVRTLVDLDRRVRSIVESGDADARTLAEIANRMPAHAWLTGISHEGNGLALEGHARDLSVVSGVIHGLMHATRLGMPTLMSATVDKEQSKDPSMKYEIHVDAEAAP